MFFLTHCWWILLVVFCLMRSTEAGCSVQNFTNNFGTAICSKKNKQKFDWLFKPPDDKPDVLFVVKLMYNIKDGDQSQEKIHLPNGRTVLPSRKLWDKAAPWCGVYAKSETNTKRACNMNARVNGICNKSIVTISQWPPRIRGNLTNFSVCFLYEYLDCAELATFSTKGSANVKPSCKNFTFVDDYGTASCEWDEHSTKSFTWTFESSSLGADVALVIKILQYATTIQNTSLEANIRFPDGTAMQNHSSLQRAHRDTARPWCGVYVERRSGGKQTCGAGSPVIGVCSKAVTAIEDWPPKIIFSSARFRLLVTYEFVNCTDISKKHVHKLLNGTDISNTPTNDTTSNSTSKVTTIVLGILFAAVSAILVAVLYKQKISSSNEEKSSRVDSSTTRGASGDVTETDYFGGNRVRSQPVESDHNQPYTMAASETEVESTEENAQMPTYAEILPSNLSSRLQTTPGQSSTCSNAGEFVANPLYGQHI